MAVSGGWGSGGESVEWRIVGSGGGLVMVGEGRKRREEMTMSSAEAEVE
jgi:hypothetical protein